MVKINSVIKSLVFLIFISLSYSSFGQDHTVAREWNEALLESIREDFARPTVHARNLWHTSIALYDAWAVFDEEASPFMLGNSIGNFTCPFDPITLPDDPDDLRAAQEEAMSFAAYRLLRHRFQYSPGGAAAINRFNTLMNEMGYNINNQNPNYASGDPAALGNYIALNLINFGLQDGSNEASSYENQYYEPVNDGLVTNLSGNPDINNPNRWQPLTLSVFIDQSGNVIPFNTPEFLSPEWGNVTPFALNDEVLSIKNRDGNDYWIYHDPGDPPYLDTTKVGGLSEEYKWGFELVSMWGAHLDPSDGVMWDISPASLGNISDYPTTIEGLQDFYNRLDGGDPSIGHAMNPATGQPYEPQMVPRGDYARVLAEFWADGPDSETPPGHWFTILNYVNDHPELIKKHRGIYDVEDDLEWDVKSYFILGGAMHDAAVTAWGIKGYYDYIRPISAIRYMCDLGQSSDPALPSFHPGGVRLEPGYIELVEAGDPLAGNNGENIGKIKLYTWKGPDFIANPGTDVAGVDWILGEEWWPYQRPTFVTPNFAGYLSGHSTFSRAAAEVLTSLTGDPFFPGGMGEFEIEMNEFLVFEDGPSTSFKLQWATYRDASDQTSLSRIWGGIHPPADDVPGRLIGMQIAEDAFNLAERFFFIDNDNDGFFDFQECDDNDPTINPDAVEICDGKDNNCSGFIDDGLPLFTYYFDTDNDGFGNAVLRLDTCLQNAPSNYVLNDLDCNDNDVNINPNAAEICDGIDNNCNGLNDDGLPKNTYYLDADGDGFGNIAITADTCISVPPTGFVVDNTDCNDGDDSLNPAMAENCDGIDNDCNGLIDDGLPKTTYFFDADGDGYGDAGITADTCISVPPIGFVVDNTDCDDQNSGINPGLADISDNAIDEDCSGIDLYKITKFFPNPVTDILTIHYDFQGEVTVHVIDANGRLIRTKIIDFIDNNAQVDMNEFQAGVYMLRLLDADGEQYLVEKILKY